MGLEVISKKVQQQEPEIGNFNIKKSKVQKVFKDAPESSQENTAQRDLKKKKEGRY